MNLKVLLMRELWGTLCGNLEYVSRGRQQAFACAASAGASAKATAAEREGPPDEDDTVWNVDADEEFGASAPRRAGLNIVLAKGRGDAGFRQSGRGLISVHSTVEPDERAYALEAYMNAIFAQAAPSGGRSRGQLALCAARGVLVACSCRQCQRRAGGAHDAHGGRVRRLSMGRSAARPRCRRSRSRWRAEARGAGRTHLRRVQER